MRTVYLDTLGCKLNYSETSTYQRQFEGLGFQAVRTPREASVCVLNSCAVTEQAQKKCRQELHKLRRANPSTFVVLVGCYADLLSQEGQTLEGVDLLVTRYDKNRLADRVVRALSGTPIEEGCGATEPYFPAFSKGGRTRAFLKVQDGCDYHCTYCAIPLARGGNRSGTIAEILEQVEGIAAAGVLEVVITGVNTGDFGRGGGERFLDLLRALDGVESIARYRISSIEPNLLSDEILSFLAGSRAFMPHFHIPLQSGSNDVLRRMGRRYTTERYAERIAAARAAFEQPFLGIDLIVGFPGETDGHFQETYDFLVSLSPSYLHLFPYSQRPGTPAAGYADQVSPATVHHRMERLLSLNTSFQEEYARSFLGREAEVLVERIDASGVATGHTANYLSVYFQAERAVHGSLCRVLLTEYCPARSTAVASTISARELTD